VENRYDDDGGSDGKDRIEESAMSSFLRMRFIATASR
jgi:hypothetical protein